MLLSVNVFSGAHVCVLKYVTQSQLLLDFELVIRIILFFTVLFTSKYTVNIIDFGPWLMVN